MKKLLLFILIILFSTPVFSKEYDYNKYGFKFSAHKHSEKAYQHAWCKAHNGIEEYKNKDYTRVDCLTKTHAVEFDFANKWAEAVGQAEYYSLMTDKRGMVVLILENPLEQKTYYFRVLRLSKKYNFDVEYITPKILKIKDGKCQYPDCKCHKTKKY